MKMHVTLETPVKNPMTPVFAMDHDIQNPKSAEKYKTISSFAAAQGIDYYPPGTGIGHQIMIEQGYAFPNQLVMASDSHSNMYGGVGALGTPIVRTDAAAIWATGTPFSYSFILHFNAHLNIPLLEKNRSDMVANSHCNTSHFKEQITKRINRERCHCYALRHLQQGSSSESSH
jgi:hypothetical protein